MGYDENTCNMHLNQFAQLVQDGMKDRKPDRIEVQYYRN